MDGLNQFLTTAFEAIFSPFYAWPLLTLLLLSVASGILMAAVFKYVSNQKALAEVLDRGRGNALAIKLFKDDLQGMFVSLSNVLLLMLKRIWYSLSPVLVLMIPLFFLLSQMYLRYENRPLNVEEPVVFELKLNETGWESAKNSVSINLNDTVNIETPALRDELEQSIAWRLSVVEPGVHTVSVKINEQEIDKEIIATASDDWLYKVSEFRSGSNVLEQLWFAGERVIQPNAIVDGISIHYPKRETPVFGFSVPWWLTYFVVSIVAALISQPFLKVRF